MQAKDWRKSCSSTNLRVYARVNAVVGALPSHQVDDTLTQRLRYSLELVVVQRTPLSCSFADLNFDDMPPMCDMARITWIFPSGKYLSSRQVLFVLTLPERIVLIHARNEQRATNRCFAPSFIYMRV